MKNEKKIVDFGQKIGGARKDLWALRGLLLEDLENMNEEEIKNFVSKANVWPFPGKSKLAKYIKEREGDRFGVYLENVVRNEVRPFSSSYCAKVSAKEYVDLVSTLKEYMRKLSPFWWKDATKRQEVQNYFELMYLADGGHVFTRKLLSLFCDISNVVLFFQGMKLEGFALEGEKRAREIVNASWQFYVMGKRNATITPDDDKRFMVKSLHFTGVDYHGVSESLHEGTMVATHLSKKKKTQATVYNSYRGEVVHGSRQEFLEEKTREFLTKEVEEEKKKIRKKTKKRFKTPEVVQVKRKAPRIIGNPDDSGRESFFINVTDKDWESVYDFYGVEFGNWTNQDYRQIVMNMAFEAMDDLARAMGISRNDLNLQFEDKQRLSLAFGARGRSGALAHFEPARNVINLTKKRGAGCVAHEYGHALDFFLGNFVHADYASKSIMRLDFCPEVRSLMQLICYNSPNFTKGSQMFDVNYCKAGNDYWSSNVEMFARAFDCYVLDKLHDLEMMDNYLTNQNKETYKIKIANGTYYCVPLGEERKRINKAFDQTFQALIKNGIFSPYKPFDIEYFGSRLPIKYRRTVEPKTEKIAASKPIQVYSCTQLRMF